MLVADIEELEKVERVRNPMLGDSTQRTFSRPSKEMNSKIPCADGTIELAGKGEEVRTSIPTQNSAD